MSCHAAMIMLIPRATPISEDLCMYHKCNIDFSDQHSDSQHSEHSFGKYSDENVTDQGGKSPNLSPNSVSSINVSRATDQFSDQTVKFLMTPHL